MNAIQLTLATLAQQIEDAPEKDLLNEHVGLPAWTL